MGSKKLMLRIFVAKTITRHSPQVGSRKHECNALTYHFDEDYVNGLVHELTHVAAYATNKHKMHDNRWWKDPFEPILWNNFETCKLDGKVAAFESITELHDWDFQTGHLPQEVFTEVQKYMLSDNLPAETGLIVSQCSLCYTSQIEFQ
uniref:Uncharacterized protein n=1 Tax=Ditylenchus dipsaci TaxID=166011 RepID=A0A915EWD7_9BILA